MWLGSKKEVVLSTVPQRGSCAVCHDFFSRLYADDVKRRILISTSPYNAPVDPSFSAESTFTYTDAVYSMPGVIGAKLRFVRHHKKS